MESRFFLDIVVAKGSSIFKLFTGENESLLIGWDTFFILDLSLHIFNGVRWLDVKSDGLSCQGLYEDLHSSSKSEYQVECWFFLDVIIAQSSSVFELLSSENKSLLIGRDTFLVLDLGLDILNGVWWLNIKSNCFSSQCFHENLHLSSCLIKIYYKYLF